MKHNFNPSVIDKDVNSGHGGAWRAMEPEEVERINQPIVAWSAWLDQSRIYLSDRHSWSDVPKIGMQVLILYLADGKRALFKNRDEYFLPGFIEQKKFGLMIDFDEYDRVTDLCMQLFYDTEEERFYTKD